MPLVSLEALAVQPLVLQLCYTLLAHLLVLLAVGPLAVHAAVLDESAGRAALELDGVAPLFAAVGAGLFAIILDRHAVHDKIVGLKIQMAAQSQTGAAHGVCVRCEADVTVGRGRGSTPRRTATSR